jgi:hypothetical protein
MQSGIAAAVSATHTASTSFMVKSALQPNEMKRGKRRGRVERGRRNVGGTGG